MRAPTTLGLAALLLLALGGLYLSHVSLAADPAHAPQGDLLARLRATEQRAAAADSSLLPGLLQLLPPLQAPLLPPQPSQPLPQQGRRGNAAPLAQGLTVEGLGCGLAGQAPCLPVVHPRHRLFASAGRAPLFQVERVRRRHFSRSRS